MKRRTLLSLAGATWLVVGISLLSFGLFLIVKAIPSASRASSPIHWMTSLTNERSQAALLVVTLGLYLGYLKGRKVLKKSAQRQIQKLNEISEPLSLSNLYTPAYLLLIGAMMGLGMALRFLPIAQDLRGLIDVAVGSALIQGATSFFRKIILGVQS